MSATKANKDEALDCGDDFDEGEVGDEGTQGTHLGVVNSSAANTISGLSPRISGGSSGQSGIKLAGVGGGGLQLGGSPSKSGGLRARR